MEQLKKRLNQLLNEAIELDKKLLTALPKSILQEAIQGKLVPQDPNDEPASVLLERIREEKLRLVKEGKLKKKDVTDSIIFKGEDNKYFEKIGKEVTCIDDEIPFDIPDSWQWARIQNIAKTNDTDSFSDGPFGSNLKREHQTDNKEVRIIQLSNIGENGWKDDNEKYTTFKHLETIARCEVFSGDFVIAKMMPAGRTIVAPSLNTKMVLGSDAMRFVPSEFINKDYLLIAMRSQCFLQQINNDVHGITRVRTSLTKLKSYFIPIPPLQEQERIVSKIEELYKSLE